MIRRFAGTAAVWMSLTVPHVAAAQSNLALDQYDPAAAGSRLFTLANPTVGRQFQPWFGYVMSYAHSPLEMNAGDQTLGAVVGHQLIAHGLIALELAQRLRLAADIPFVLSQGGDSPTFGGRTYASPHDKTWGDVRLGGHLAVLDQRGARPAGALGMSAWLPTGNDGAFASAGTTRWNIEALLGADYEHWVWRVAVGFKRQSDTAYFATGHNGWTAAGGVAYRYGSLQLGPELWGFAANDVKTDAFTKHSSALEWLFGVRYSRWPIAIGVAAGSGLTTGQGTPRYRMLLSLDYTPGPGGSKPLPREATEHRDIATDTPAASGMHAAPEIIETIPFAPARLGLSHSTSEADDQQPHAACGSATDTRCTRDTDGDEIDDAHDACPNEKGHPNVDPALNGCLNAVVVEGEQLVLTQQVRFALGSDEILAESDGILGQLARAIQGQPEIARIAVDGHTDNVGAEARNLALSRKRALAVVRWLVAHGVDERRLEARGFGPRQPVAPNNTEQGRTLNRRVEFHVLKRTNLGKRGWKDGATDD